MHVILLLDSKYTLIAEFLLRNGLPRCRVRCRPDHEVGGERLGEKEPGHKAYL